MPAAAASAEVLARVLTSDEREIAMTLSIVSFIYTRDYLRVYVTRDCLRALHVAHRGFANGASVVPPSKGACRRLRRALRYLLGF